MTQPEIARTISHAHRLAQQHHNDRGFLAGKRTRAEDLDSAIRIFLEFLQGYESLEIDRPCVTVFGSARFPSSHPYYRMAQDLGRLLAEAGYAVMTGGGPGIMEAANRGAQDAGGKTVGLNIRLPHEQWPNPYITPSLCFDFHYFFMRKFWFAYLAKALVVFPGGFGTLDELSELLTLAQTQKLEKKIVILLYGSEFWKEVLNFDALVRYGMISEKDLDLFEVADDPPSALRNLQDGLTRYYLKPGELLPAPEQETPAIAKSRI